MPFKKCLSCGRRFISASGGFVKCVKCRGRECTKEKDCKAGDDVKKISTPAAAIDISYTKGSVDVGHFLSSDRRLYDQNMAQLEERNSSLKQSVDDNHHMKNIESTIKRNDFETIRSNDKLISYTKGNVGVDVIDWSILAYVPPVIDDILGVLPEVANPPCAAVVDVLVPACILVSVIEPRFPPELTTSNRTVVFKEYK